ncbi:MAG: DUF3616 domain-containing protein [Granulosicoccus sp.]
MKRIYICSATIVFLLSSLSFLHAADYCQFFCKLDGVYEPSGAVSLPDGRVLVIEDEAEWPISVLKSNSVGSKFSVERVSFSTFTGSAGTKLNDLEGVVIGPAGGIYAITSHSRDSRGKRSKSREKIIRSTLENNRLSKPIVRRDLRQSLVAEFPILKYAAKERILGTGNALSIEGLSFDSHGHNLWLGFREPVVDGKSVIISISNPVSALENNEPFVFNKKPILLDLDRGGIRDIVYDHYLDGYLIVTQREGTKKEKRFKLWFWSGNEKTDPIRIKIAGVDNLKRTEGITTSMVNGQKKLLLLSDDGDRRKRIPANYLMVNYNLLQSDSGRIVETRN